MQALFYDERTQKNAKSQTKYSNGNRRGGREKQRKRGGKKEDGIKVFLCMKKTSELLVLSL